jgi:hypothetical protein
MTNLYATLHVLQHKFPDDIANKILLLLLGIAPTMSAGCIKSSHKENRTSCGLQYEISRTYNGVQQMAICEIRIAQFDSNRNRKNRGSIKNIKKYMAFLELSFKQRYKRLFC